MKNSLDLTTARMFTALLVVAALLGVSVGVAAPATAAAGDTWTARNAAEANQWYSVAYGNGLFVAVSSRGEHRVMSSPDGIHWTPRQAPENNSWLSVTYGNGMFVTVSTDGDHRVMSSPDGIHWTAHYAAENNTWRSVAYGHGRFVAVSRDGDHRVMTSRDGKKWTSRQAAAVKLWWSVAYGNGRFVAVSATGTNQVMTSPDGITWTTRTTPQSNSWRSVTYGGGKFVAASPDGANQVMTSPDGIAWTTRATPGNNQWSSVAYGDDTFVVVSAGGTNNVMTSPDGINWTTHPAAQNNYWTAVTHGNGLFVAVSFNGPNQVMTSGTLRPLPGAPTNVTATPGDGQVAVSWTPPANSSGSSITGYQVKASPGGTTCATTGVTTCTIPGLRNGTAYTFTVTASSAIGTGHTSQPSGPAIPTPSTPVAPTPSTPVAPGTGTPAAPQPASYTPLKRNKTRVKWEFSTAAIGHRVLINGKLECTAVPGKSRCRVKKAYGPRADVRVIALGANANSQTTAKFRRSNKNVVFDTVRFSRNSAKLNKASARRARKDTKALARQGFKKATVFGYTAKDENIARLSKKRAAAVKTVMLKKLRAMKVNMRVRTIARGNKNPIGNNNTRKGRTKNRRATITIR